MDSSDFVIDAPACPLLTIEEAARVLRVGRSLVYQLANEYLATGGNAGDPRRRVSQGAALGFARTRPRRPGRAPV
jgi:hypothetical protein